MRIIVVAFIIVTTCLTHDAQAADCVPVEFGRVKVEVDESARLLKLPKQINLPERGLAINSEGYFVNEGLSDWLILDLENRSLTHVVFMTNSRYLSGTEYKNYKESALPPDWVELRRTLLLPSESLNSIICKANYIWSYESPSSAALREGDKERRAFEAWEKAFKRCSRKRACQELPPPPEVAPIPFDLVKENPFFTEATDVGEMLILKDHGIRKSVGGGGVLSGEAAALRGQLINLMTAQAN